jgi:hypothetical protein
MLNLALCVSGLANVSLLEGHIIRKISPDGLTCVYMYLRGGVINYNAVIYKHEFVLVIFINVVTLCSVESLYYAFQIVLLKLFR